MRAKGEGTIRKRVHKRSNGTTYIRYYAIVSYIGIDGKQQRKYGKARQRQTEAQADLAELTAKYRDITPDAHQTLEQYLDSWLEQKQLELKPRSIEEYKRSKRLHLPQKIARTKLLHIKPAELQRCFTQLETRSRSNARKLRSLLHAALEDAMVLEIVDRNPVKRTKTVKPPKRSEKVWEPDEAARFLIAAAGMTRHYTLFALIIATGLRAGEVLGLRWQDYDGSNLNITNQLMTKGDPVLAPPKTQSGVRIIALAPDIIVMLEDWKSYVEKMKHLKGFNDQGFMFPSRKGTGLRLENVRREFNRVIDATGSDDQPPIQKIRIHDLRHYHLSRLIALGIDPAAVSARAGHSRISTTMDIYVHAFDDQKQRTAIGLAELISHSPAIQPPDESESD